jgi:hypothetical protein
MRAPRAMNGEFSEFPQIHPRHAVVSEVQNCISDGIKKAVTEHGPTYAELLMALARETIVWAAYQVQDERK